MSDEHSPDSAAHEVEEEQGRRPYEPPAIVKEESFETVAMGCGGQTYTACEDQWKFS